MSNLKQHLGGHNNVTHIDRGALRWAVEQFDVKSFLDIGCGPGGMVKHAESIGLEALGIDGDNTVKRYDNSKFHIHDYTVSEYKPDKIYDLGWSCEFVEHVHEQYIPNFMPCFQACKTVIMTYAPPGFPGHHHVNCQTEDYWIAVFSQYGFVYSAEYTEQLRMFSTMNTDKEKSKQFVKNTGLVFVN